MKIFRLSIFNLKKNKKEAAAIVFLTMITVFLLSVALSNILGLSNTFDECFQATGCYEYMARFSADHYRSMFWDILEEDFGITENVKISELQGLSVNVKDMDGEKIGYNLFFTSKEAEQRIEDFVIEESLSEDEIRALEHPIWVPVSLYLRGGYKPGDTIHLIIGGRDYPFTVAGIYHAGIGNESGYGFRLVLTEEDYNLLTGIFDEYVTLAFNGNEGFDLDVYMKACEERSSTDMKSITANQSKAQEKLNEITFAEMFMMLSVFVSVITMCASIYLIRHKISNDIEDQIQQIGVLEALGYRSVDISLSYVCEYVITSFAGAVLGILAACMLSPFMDSFVGGLMGRIIHRSPAYLKVISVALIVVLLTIAFACLKTGIIKRFPPVVAFRRGIRTHHFGKNIMPLTKAGRSINTRLAMKSFFKNIRTNLGAGLCIVLAGIALMFGLSGWAFFQSDGKGVVGLLGEEMADERISLLDGADAYAFADEVRRLPEVRKALVSYSLIFLSAENDSYSQQVIVHDDFTQTENIFVSEGEFPKLDNEIAISLKRSRRDGLKVGDSITMVSAATKKSYLITGIVAELGNSAMNTYMTGEGYLRVAPNARPDLVEVFLTEGTDREQFEKKLASLYGASAKDLSESSASGESLKERIQSIADEKMATLITNYGVTDIDYAIMIGDELITGRSTGLVIREMTSFIELAKSQLDPIVNTCSVFFSASAIFVTIVVAVILTIIAGANVKRQRKELGIMKSMGFTSKDLMKQLAISMLPVTVISTVIAAFLGTWFYKMFWVMLFGVEIETNILLISGAAVFLIAFCYLVTYLAAGKIRQVSVTELMTE